MDPRGTHLPNPKAKPPARHEYEPPVFDIPDNDDDEREEQTKKRKISTGRGSGYTPDEAKSLFIRHIPRSFVSGGVRGLS